MSPGNAMSRRTAAGMRREHTMKEILTGLYGYPAMSLEMPAVVREVVATAKHGGEERQS